MTSIFKYIKSFYQKEFEWPYFLLVLSLLGLFLFFNYHFGIERKWVNTQKSWVQNFFNYFLFYSIPFAASFALQYFFAKDASFLKQPWLWAIIVLGPAIFSLKVNFNFYEPTLKHWFMLGDYIFWNKCISYVCKVLVVVVAIAIVWFIKDRQQMPLYGLNPLQSVQPYFTMILIMVPLIALASMQADFLRTYPKSQFMWQAAGVLPRWRYVLYELCYGLDFLSIEIFFRGFLVLSLFHVCDTKALIPIAVFYSTIHFGKPMGEAISSFWGGLLLGIVSYHTQSIWGGLIVHLGIAWLMEIGGSIGHWYAQKS